MMTLNETYEREFSIPLRIVDVPRNVVITSDPDTVVRFTVRDKGYMIAAYATEEAFHPIFIDYKVYTDGKGHGEISAADIQRLIYLQLAKSSKITSVKSGNYTFSFNFGLHKKVPVKLLGKVIPGTIIILHMLNSFLIAYKCMLPGVCWIVFKRYIHHVNYLEFH